MLSSRLTPSIFLFQASGDYQLWPNSFDDNTVGLFSGYDSNDGTPPQWLTKHGFPKDMTGIHFWTSIPVPPPKRSDYANDWEGTNTYEGDLQRWKQAGPQHFYVDSYNRTLAIAQDTAQAHVVAVQTIDAAHSEPLCTSDYTPSNA